MLLIQTAFDQEYAAVRRAKITTQRTCKVLMTGMGPQAARTATERCLKELDKPPNLVISIGLAGGLSPSLPFGHCCVIDQVRSLANDQLSEPLVAQNQLLSPNLIESLGLQSLVTIPQVAFSAASKRQLASRCAVDADPSSPLATLCDMETYAVADVCRQWRLPWVGARVVSDTIDDSMAPWIGLLPGLMAQRRWWRMARLIATHPQDLPSLIRLAVRMQKLEKQLTQLTNDLVAHVLPAR